MKRSLQFCGNLFLFLAVFIAWHSLSAQLLNPLSQTKFTNPLPRPGLLEPTSPGGNDYVVNITQVEQELGLKDPAGDPLITTVWGYGEPGKIATYPGPTIEAFKDQPVTVTWNNELVDVSGKPLPHLFPVDESLIDFNKPSSTNFKGIPTVTHLHGGHTDAASDGNPMAWYTPGVDPQKGVNYVQKDYNYKNDQEAATLWYHDHTMGITRLNVYAGLAGFYLLRDDNEKNLNLPSGAYEVPLVIQDRSFYSDGSLYYPTAGGGILPEMFGDFILVNGAVWPVLDVEPRKYRLRLLNGSDSRFYDLYIPGVDFYQIGSDGGLLNSPVLTNRIVIGPGERIDIIVDFSAVAGQQLILKNNARSPYPFGVNPNPNTTGQIMAFRVATTLSAPDTSVIPPNLRELPTFTGLGPTTNTRQLALFEGTEVGTGRLKPMLGTVADGPLDFMDDIIGTTENPALDAIEEWEIYNTTPDAHPIHLHLVHFQVINTQKFNVKKFIPGNPASIQFLGQPTTPSAVDAGLKDTFVVLPGQVARVKALFDKEGLYVWHCHILSHEDFDMMRPFYVGEMPALVAELGKNVNSEGLLTGSQDLEAEILTSLKVAPNPFKETTQINFSFKEDAVVILRVYDFLGRAVAAPFSGAVKANQNYEVQFDRKGLPGSTYICKLITSDGRSYEKLILVN